MKHFSQKCFVFEIFHRSRTFSFTLYMKNFSSEFLKICTQRNTIPQHLYKIHNFKFNFYYFNFYFWSFNKCTRLKNSFANKRLKIELNACRCCIIRIYRFFISQNKFHIGFQFLSVINFE